MLGPMASPQEFPPVLTAALAAELLQVHVEYLRKMVREGRVPSHRFPGGRELRFLRDELLEWLADLPGGRPDQTRPDQDQPDRDVLDQDPASRTHATDDIGTYESPTTAERTRT
jgi:excisionase family DNA binding protein